MQAWKPIRNGETVEGISDTQDKALHARLKRPVANTYSMTSIVSAEPVVDDTIRYLLRRLDDVFISKGLPCDIDNWVQYCTYDNSIVCTSRPHQWLLKPLSCYEHG